MTRPVSCKYFCDKHDECCEQLFCSVQHRPHELTISFSHQAPALLDEEYPIVIDVTNLDERHLDVVVDVLLQPTEVDEACMMFRPVLDA